VPSQAWPATHWSVVVHMLKQSFAEELHEYGAQITVGPVRQCPIPSQTCSPVTESPSQAPGMHIVPLGYLRQAPAPSHVPSRPQVLEGDIAQSEGWRGSPPLTRETQVPSDPVSAQVRQPLVQASLQQNPSTQ
jgi:hypothetical protein